MKKNFFILLTLSSFAFAQRQTDSLEFIMLFPPQNVLTTAFDKQLNTYYLNSSFIFNDSWDRISLSVKENFTSTFIQSAQKSIRDEQHFNISGSYRLSPFISGGMHIKNSILSDSRKIEINQASVSNVLLFTEINPAEKIHITPFGGYSNNRQIGVNNYGPVYGMEGMLNNLTISDILLSSELKFKNEDISPRKNTIRHTNILVSNYFSENVGNFLSMRFSQNRKDFYYIADSSTAAKFSISNNIQSRIETNYLLEERLNYNNFLEIFNLDLMGRLNWRSIDRDTRFKNIDRPSSSIFDTRIEEFRIELESFAGYSSKFFEGSLRINYAERDERHLTKSLEGVSSSFFQERSETESSKNNSSARGSVTFNGIFNLSETDNITFSLLQNRLKYDTPSELNFDDRDELLSIIRLRYSKKLTPFFETFVNAEGTVSHTVYLFSEKSSNNNINRVVRLASGGYYRGKNFSSLNTFEVSANYTVYDFEDINPGNRSFSFRQFTATDSSTAWFTKRFGFGVFGYVKLSEQGDLRWASFSTRPSRYLKEIFAEPRFLFKYGSMLLGLGARLFLLDTYNYLKNVKTLGSESLSIGPLAEINYLAANKLYLKIYGWYEFITQDEAKKEQASLFMQVNWNF